MGRAGHRLGQDHVARRMRIVGITGVVRGRHHTVTTRPADGPVRHADLVGRQWSAALFTSVSVVSVSASGIRNAAVFVSEGIRTFAA